MLRSNALWPRVAAALTSCATASALLMGCTTSAPPPQLIALPALNTLNQDKPADGPRPFGPQVQKATTPSRPAPAQTRWLQLARLAIPEYWQSSTIRYRQADNAVVEVWPQAQWAERLEVGLTRTLHSALLSAAPSPWQLCTQVCGDTQQRPYRLLVDLAPMDYDRQARLLHTTATWSLSTATGRILLSGTQRIDTLSTHDSAQGQAQALAGMTQTLANGIVDSLLTVKWDDIAR